MSKIHQYHHRLEKIRRKTIFPTIKTIFYFFMCKNNMYSNLIVFVQEKGTYYYVIVMVT